jgi:GNAT superfamily N-acetyltransferase
MKGDPSPLEPAGLRIDFRRMTQADVPAGLALCRASGWNQTAADWELFLEVGRDGCRVAVMGNRVVGTATVVNYEARFAWIGMVLVDADVRGRGIGSALLRDALDRLGEVPARLDATPKGHPLYLKLGFVEECRLKRMTTTSTPTAAADAAGEARRMRREDLDAVAGWDRSVFGADRRRILEWALEAAPELAFVVERGTSLRGYCLGRRGYLFRQIGPVVADDLETARRLVEACRRRAADIPMAIDVPVVQERWSECLAATGFADERPFIRMCRGANLHPGRPDLQLAIFGPEWG